MADELAKKISELDNLPNGDMDGFFTIGSKDNAQGNPVSYKMNLVVLKNAIAAAATAVENANNAVSAAQAAELAFLQSIVQQTGQNTDKTMSQKAVTDALAAIGATVSEFTGKVGDIIDMIPSSASQSNQLADKAFVNSSIGTSTATYISNNGEPFTSVAQLNAYTGPHDKNDYAFVVSTDVAGNTVYSRYKYDGSEWAKEYDLNNSSFTAAQWAAINSAVTAELVAKLSALPDNATLTAALAAKQDVIDDLSSIRSKANSAYQKPSGGIPASDIADGVIPNVSGKVNTSDIADNLTTNDATKVLSAKQGKVLNENLTQLGQGVDELRDDVGDKEEIIHRIDLAFTLESGKIIAVESSTFGKNSADANLQRTSYIPIGDYIGKKLVFSQLVDTANPPIAGAVFYSSLSQNAGIEPGYVATSGSSYGLIEVEVTIPNNATHFRFTIPNGFDNSAYCYIKEIEYTYTDGLGKSVQELEEEQNDTVLSLNFLPPVAKYASVSSGKVSYYNVSGAESVQIPAGLFIGKTIKITASMPNSTYNVVCVIADRMGNSLGFYKNGTVTEYKDFEVTIPVGAFYIYINYKDTSSPVVRINYEGGTIGDYLLQLSSNADLWGKSCVCFGDSITWYDGQVYNWGKEQGKIAKGYESYMRELGMVVNNMGYSGANITVILSQIRSTDVSSYDFVTITSGANDSRYQIPVGELAEIGSLFDETTFIGALQAGIEYVLTNNPTAKILLMTPIKGWIYYPEGYVNAARPLVSGDGIVEKKYADAIKAVAAFYSLPVCDWYNKAGVNLLTRSWFMNDPDPDPEATPNPNDLYSLHPTTAGYKRMADILIPVLRNM